MIYRDQPIKCSVEPSIKYNYDIEIEEAAVSAGMKTLKVSCLNHMILGNTTADEFVRVLGYANE